MKRWLRTICLAVAAGVLLSYSALAYQSKARDWSTCTYGGAATCLLLESLTAVSDGTGTYSDGVSTPRGDAGYTHVGCYHLVGRGFNDQGGWHRVSSIRSPNATCVDSDVWTDWDVLIAGTPYMGKKSGSQYVCAIFSVTCYDVTLHNFTFASGESPPPAPNVVTGYTSDAGYDTAACFNTPGC